MKANPGDSATKVLPLEVAAASYALPLPAVREVLPYEPPTPVAGMPASICGLLGVRGSVVPVIDLGEKLGRGESEPTPRTRVVVVEAVVGGARIGIGLVVDAVGEPLELPPGRAGPRSTSSPGSAARMAPTFACSTSTAWCRRRRRSSRPRTRCFAMRSERSGSSPLPRARAHDAGPDARTSPE